MKKNEDSREDKQASPEEVEDTEEIEVTDDEADIGEGHLDEEDLEEEEVERRPRRKEEEEEFVEERIYTIPLRRAWIMPPRKRAPKAIRLIRFFIQRHMKVGKGISEESNEEEGGHIIISNEVNERVWNRGVEKPPRKLRIRAAKDEKGNVTIFLA